MPQKNVYGLIKEAEQFLKESGVEDNKSSAKYLMSAVLGIERNKLACVLEKELSADEFSRFCSFVLRRAKHEPTQYILGQCNFMGFDFLVNPDVLVPRPETELLVEKALEINSIYKKNTVLDLCCGSGAIAISLCLLGDFEKIIASDISQPALNTARENAKKLGAEKINFVSSDCFDNLCGLTFDIIVCNPPYISDNEKHLCGKEIFYEPHIALFAGDDGLFFYKKIAKEASRFINKNGHILLELNANLADEIKDIFSANGYLTLEILRDYGGLKRILWIKL
jgi:release factor glutamine methyltransferase